MNPLVISNINNLYENRAIASTKAIIPFGTPMALSEGGLVPVSTTAFKIIGILAEDVAISTNAQTARVLLRGDVDKEQIVWPTGLDGQTVVNDDVALIDALLIYSHVVPVTVLCKGE